MIKIYSTKKCPECIRIKAFLESKGVLYQNIDMTKVSLKEQAKLNIRSVPTIEFNGKRITKKELEKKYE